ncbi:MAG TPA: acetate kinase [Terriglobia bacterium]|nr:acetate kinase [Terriglobia bacterium]
MKILVLNCGSSSLKFQLIETSPEQIAANQDRLVARGEVERIGSGDARITCDVAGHKAETARPIAGFQDAIREALEAMKAAEGASVRLEEIEAVGHRVVHGGERFHQSVRMDEAVVREIESLSDLAPLHNPHNLKGYEAARELLPAAVHVAVFDTAFHQTLPPRAYLYGLPYVCYTRDKIRRYGFHGISHRYVSRHFAQLHAAKPEAFKLITCHLGNGCSVCAIDRGKSVDTSMGFTPLEGLVMGTRSGDLDPGAVFHLAKRDTMDMQRVDAMLNERSGLLGISGVSNDMRDLLGAREQGNPLARLAIEVFCYRVAKYIGAYFVVLGGADAIIFTGGIGENAAAIRAQICASLGALGVRLDSQKNEQPASVAREISSEAAATRLWVIPTNEELLIARDSLRCILKIPHP